MTHMAGTARPGRHAPFGRMTHMAGTARPGRHAPFGRYSPLDRQEPRAESLLLKGSSMHSETINYVEYMAGLVARARKAQSIARGYDQERVDELCEAVSYAALDDQFRARAAEMLVKEAGLGNVADKMLKIRNKAMGIYRDMKGVKSTGIIAEHHEKNLVTYIKPIGVIGGFIPVTNSEVMPIIAALWASAVLAMPSSRELGLDR